MYYRLEPTASPVPVAHPEPVLEGDISGQSIQDVDHSDAKSVAQVVVVLDSKPRELGDQVLGSFFGEDDRPIADQLARERQASALVRHTFDPFRVQVGSSKGIYHDFLKSVGFDVERRRVLVAERCVQKFKGINGFRVRHTFVDRPRHNVDFQRATHAICPRAVPVEFEGDGRRTVRSITLGNGQIHAYEDIPWLHVFW